MKQFFSQTEALAVDNSLLSAQSYFSDHKISGLIEKQVNDDKTAVLLIVGGLPRLAYMLENEIVKSISLAEFSSLSDSISYFRAIKLSDVAGRLTWLALESEAKNKYSIPNADAWKNRLEEWKYDRWSGLLEITGKSLHGFALFWQGDVQRFETVFSTQQGFSNEFPPIEGSPDSSWEVTLYAYVPSTLSYQCTLLRRSAMGWGHNILSRYQEMVGQKLLQLMVRELNRQIVPWQWNISLDKNILTDSHFFASISDATHAYRSLFMGMGAQMNFVIGNTLTQRLLDDTFQMIHPDERTILRSERLIPAAFSQ